ncbi:hypothetical protein [Neptunomonas japonica]|uniref:Uncharacterized protein n=1 Tax=Neptunomonas japonica JAMM 1380 TaxID=1441457 RepID=A0A7R6SW62_9GAMM|nr:hypothetical protein [Neptunomonas japonica]BBB29387.1 hypothetical protein NEJAP_1435 [Neptunomonas japonica JAMM 1380]
MKIEKYLGLIAAILGVITFIDQYLWKSKLLNNLAIPDSIPTSIFLIVLAVVCFVFFFSSRKEIALPYPDQRTVVQDLNDKLRSSEERIDELSHKNEELLPLKRLFDGNEHLQDKIHGILLKGSLSSDNLIKELEISPKNKDAIANFQAVIGRMGKQDLVSTTSLGYYKLP